VPIRARMASCQKVHNLLHVKPHITQFRLYGKVNQESIEFLLDTFATPKLLETKSINIVTNDFTSDVLTYQASLALGIHCTHTLPLLNSLCGSISSRLLTTSELDALVHRISSHTNSVLHGPALSPWARAHSP
jgi:hypothetical protein